MFLNILLLLISLVNGLIDEQRKPRWERRSGTSSARETGSILRG